MARRVFFSFHYRDIMRVNVVRNSWLTQDRESAGFFDGSLWEEAELKGATAIQKLIDDGLKNTSVTIVLIGSQTANRTYINYEIIQSFNRGNGLLGVYIHNIPSPHGVAYKGQNPFDFIVRNELDGSKTSFSRLFPTYDYVSGNGYNNLGLWIETAARQAGK